MAEGIRRPLAEILGLPDRDLHPSLRSRLEGWTRVGFALLQQLHLVHTARQVELTKINIPPGAEG